MRIFTSSINPVNNTRNASLFVISSRSAIKKRNNIGETGNPYGIPVSTRNCSDSLLNNLIVDMRSVRKLLTYFTIPSGIFLFRRL